MPSPGDKRGYDRTGSEMVDVQTNLRILKPSRRAPKPGDVFVIQLPDESYLFGRVITPEARWTKAEGAGPAVLIYI